MTFDYQKFARENNFSESEMRLLPANEVAQKSSENVARATLDIFMMNKYIEANERLAKSNDFNSKAMIWLTVVIAIGTIAMPIITILLNS